MTEARARSYVLGRSAGRCELRRHAPATDYSHRIARGRGGIWAPSNAIHLCSGCHAWCHANPRLAETAGLFVFSGQEALSTPVYLDGVLGPGWWLLDDDGGFQWIDGSDEAFAVPELPPVPRPPFPRPLVKGNR